MPDSISTYDPSTPVGEVRLYIPDKIEGKMLFSDAEVAVFLKNEGNVIELAAAAALGIIATDVAMTLKYIKTNSMEQDGTKPANVVLNRAKMLREQVQAKEEDDESDEDAWEFD